MSRESCLYRVRGLSGPPNATVKTFNPDPQFFKQAIEWCMVHIGSHGDDWHLEEYQNIACIVITSSQDVVLFKLTFPDAYVTEYLFSLKQA